MVRKYHSKNLENLDVSIVMLGLAQAVTAQLTATTGIMMTVTIVIVVVMTAASDIRQVKDNVLPTTVLAVTAVK